MSIKTFHVYATYSSKTHTTNGTDSESIKMFDIYYVNIHKVNAFELNVKLKCICTYN